MDISTLLLDFRITSHCNLGCDFIDYPVAHSLMHLNDDEIHGVRPEEFPDEAMKVKWITGWHAEYQHFTDNLPVHLRERIMVYDHPDDIDVFSDKVIQKAMMLRT